MKIIICRIYVIPQFC